MNRSMHIALALLLAALGCKKGDKASDEKAPSADDFGEAIGAKVEGKGNVPAFELAFAVTKGRDPVPLLGPLVSTLSKAIGACPAFATEASSSPVPVQFTVDKGKAKVAPYKDPTPGVQCLASKIEGQSLANESFPPVEARAEIKVASAAPAASGSP